jgi:Tol biopolymer transport system component
VRRTLVLFAMMALCGFAANRSLAALQTRTTAGSLVNTTSPQIRLPGTIFVSQDGAIYAIAGSTVRLLPLPSGGEWIQPRALPDGSLLAVRRFNQYSDLYHVTASGRVLNQMSAGDQSTSNKTLQLDHWVLWPVVSPDGSTVYFATDSPKPAPGQSYEVDFSLWAAPLSGALTIGGAGVAGGTRWSFRDKYTGGDIEPVPLPDGNLLYSSYANTGKGTVVSVLGLQTSPGSTMVSLTTPAQDCGAPAVAADGVTIAMVCTNRGQTANIEVATLEGTTLSGAHVVVANCLCNSPSWSPSGDNLLYMNASDPGGNFGLWYIANAGSAHTGAAKRVTDAGVNLDATSSAAWMTR